MDFINVQWQGQPPVSVTTPYNPESTWTPASWVRDGEAQTLSLHEVVREVLINMVMDGLTRKGLPLMACPHTKGLQLENVISGIVDSHSIMCSHTPQQQQQQQQPDPYGNWTGSIPLQDVDDDDLETQHASHIVAQLTEFATSAYDPSVSTGGKARKPLQQSGSLSIGKQQAQRKRPANTTDQKSGEDSKRRKSAPGTVYKCQKCDKVFTLNKDLIRHEARHSLDRPFKCDQCDYSAKTQHQRSKHVRMIHNNKYPHYCGTCGKGCHSLKSKIEHEYCHLKSEDKPFKCRYCNKGLPSQRRLDEHVRLHEEDKRINCEMCKVKFVTSNGYKSHLKLVHKAVTSTNSNKCLVCDLEMVERHLLMEHMKDNHKDVGYSCTDCGMKFASEQKLEAHLNRHHRKLPLLAQSSEVSFNVEGAEKPFMMCELCGGLFADASTLSQHMPIHKENEKGLTDDAILRITNAQRQIAGFRGRYKRDEWELKTKPCPSKNTPKAKLGRPPNPSQPHGNQKQVSKPKTVLPKQCGKSKMTLRCTNKLSKSKASKTLEKHSENKAISVKHAVPTTESDENRQLKTIDKPVGVSPSKEAFIIYTKSPDKVADMLLKGRLKLSLKVPVPRSANSSSSKDQNVNQASDPSRQVLVPSEEDSSKHPVLVGQSITTAVGVTSNTSSGTTPSSSKAVLPIPPVKLIVTTDTRKSSLLPSTTPQPQTEKTPESSVIEQAKDTEHLEGSHLQETTGKVGTKDGQATAREKTPSRDETDPSSSNEPLIICTSSPDNMMDILKKGEMKVLISQKEIPPK